jgi:hypothetical protein
MLFGTHEQMADDLRQRRERFGFSYVAIFERDLDAFAPVVALLRGELSDKLGRRVVSH